MPASATDKEHCDHKVGYAMNSKSKLERLKAYHEAGHAVMARTLGMAMSYVTMLPPTT